MKLKINYQGDCEETVNEEEDKPYLQLIKTLLGQFNGSIEFSEKGDEVNIVLNEIKI